ncbi:MAG: DUF3048 domain-containing protein [Candidatus Nanopelagicales bacterium]|nr:DUF3048 domain-containing protein [Candidatus Nanopelagicales bacterium]
MTRSPLRLAPWIFGALALSTVLSACASGSSTNSAVTTPSASPTPSASSSASPTSSPSPQVTPTPTPTPTSPLTGLTQLAPQPVLVVKLDNTRNALPHAGLTLADIVYLEEVEYGITRIAAVFNSTIPDRIGPVRSARITDLDLLSQYGSPGFAFSGAQRKLWPAIDASSLIDLSANKAPSDYQRDGSRRAPYNYFLNGQEAVGDNSDISVDRSIGLTFAAVPPAGGVPTTAADLKWSYASARFKYDPGTGRYAVNLNGERATAEEGDGRQWADTVVIQLVKQNPSAYFDKGGGNTPHAKTIGQGKAIVLRDGLSYQATWSRESAESGTLFTNELGIPLSFKPGQTWIALYDKSREVKLKPRVTASTSPSGSPSPTN